MAYTPLSAKDGGGTLRQFLADVIGGNYFARIKMLWGAQGAVNEVSAATPLPISAVDQSGLPGVFVEASPDNAAYVVPAVGMSAAANGGALAFGVASVASPAITGSLVVVCATQPCFVLRGAAPVATVNTSDYVPANTRSPFIILPGNKIAAIRPAGGSDGTLYYSVIG